MDDTASLQRRLFLATQEHPSTFEVVAAGRSTGEQDILRAELHAIVSVILNIGQGHVHADSQPAIDYVALALAADSPSEFARKDHMDLLMQVWHRRHAVQITLHKVKAHENLTQYSNMLDCYAALGIWKADNAAGDIVLKAIPEVATKHQQCHEFLQQQMEHLHTVLQLHHDVKDIAVKTMETHKPELALSHDHRQIWDAFRQWRVPQPHFVAPDADVQFLRLSMFDEELAVDICQLLDQTSPRRNTSTGLGMILTWQTKDPATPNKVTCSRSLLRTPALSSLNEFGRSKPGRKSLPSMFWVGANTTRVLFVALKCPNKSK